MTPTSTAQEPALGGARPRLSVVVLGYRAGESLGDFVASLLGALAPIDGRWELVLVANYWTGSDDTTPAVARRLAAGDERIRVVAEPKRGGMGWDMRSGFAAARGDYVAVIDGDGQMPGRDVARVFTAIRDRGADLGKTYRESRGDGALRRLLSLVYNGLFRLFFPGPRVRDVNSKPKVIERTALERMRLESTDWFVDAEIMIAARRLDLEIVEVPTSFARLDGRQSFVRLGAVLEFLRNLVRYRVREWRR